MVISGVNDESFNLNRSLSPYPVMLQLNKRQSINDDNKFLVMPLEIMGYRKFKNGAAHWI